MFETHGSAEVSTPIDLSDEGVRTWSYINKQLQLPWFHVLYTYEDSDLNQIVFLSDIDQLLYLKEKTKAKILEVNLVSPDHVNNKGSWAMDALKEVWRGKEPGPEHVQFSEIFVLSNGFRYTHSLLDTSENDLLSKEIIFSL